MKRRVISTMCVLFSGLFLMNGCAMRHFYDNSFNKLREDTSQSYSQQVVDVVVDLVDKSNLPVFMKVEAGNAAWNPAVRGSIDAQIPGPWNANTTSLVPSLSGQDALTSSIQFNDFSTAAMLRINSLYEFLCFPIEFDDVYMPNGTLYTTVSVKDSSEGLFFAREMSDRGYLGVPPEKKGEFLMFANDVIYWSQNANPDPKDLRSPAGLIYRFSVEYRESLMDLAKGQRTLIALQEDLQKMKENLDALEQDYDQAEKEAKNTESNTSVIQDILKFKREDLQAGRKSMGLINDQIVSTQVTIQSSRENLKELVKKIRIVMEQVQENDPDFQGDIDTTIAMFEGHIAQAMQGDINILEDVKGTDRRGTGLDATESVDELYRERFEALPQRFEGAFQAQ